MEKRSEWITDTWKGIKASGLLNEDDTAIIFYSVARLRERLAALRGIFGDFGGGTGRDPVHTVAVKTNPQRRVLEEIVKAGFGLEAASFEEVKMAVEAGAPYDRITYNSPVKTEKEIRYCEDNYPGLRLNVNSFHELARISEKTSLNIGMRINPLIHAGSDELYNVSGEESKFGIPIHRRDEILDYVRRYAVETLHLHVGSQVGDTGKVVEAIGAVTELARSTDQIKSINIGGGIPAGSDRGQSLQAMQQYAALIAMQVPQLQQYRLITEFGQWVHKHNGIVFSQVEYVSNLGKKKIAYVHVGADLFMREAYTSMNALEFLPLKKDGDPVLAEKELYDVAGPLCFNGDYLGKNLLLPAMQPGDVLAIEAAGANNYGLWSRHCSRAIPAVFTDDLESGQFLKVSDRQYFS